MANVTIKVANATDMKLYADTLSGAAFSSSSGTIAPGQSVTFTATAVSVGGLPASGKLALYTDDKRSGTPFVFSYQIPASDDAPVLAGTAPEGFVMGAVDKKRASGVVDAYATAYPGILVDEGHYAIDLTSDPMEFASDYPWVFADLIENMFSGVHSAGPISTACATINPDRPKSELPTVFYADYTGGQADRIVGMWKEYWLHGQGSACPGPDAVLLDFFKTWIKDHKPNLWLPLLKIHDAGPPAEFILEDYAKIEFFDGKNWSGDAVDRFLRLIFSGAHIVQVCATNDTGVKYNANDDLYARFTKSTFNQGNDHFSSHYVTPDNLHFNTTGWYFLATPGEQMAAKVQVKPGTDLVYSGLLVAFLASITVPKTTGGGDAGKYNGFFQLEGWQQQGVTGGTRHMLDFDLSGRVAWNISTFGASPYSEKRGTSVFLAPPGWEAAPTQKIAMTPYAGAYGVQKKDEIYPQKWLRTELVRILKGASPLLPQFVIGGS